MNKETLQKANELSNLISEHESALLCFEYDANKSDVINRHSKPDIRSANPKLIIEHDAFDGDWYREMQPIPMALSDFLITVIKQQIEGNLGKLKKEFENL